MNRFGVPLVLRRGYASSTFRAAETIVKKTDRANTKPDPEKLVFGASYSDHMLTIKHSTQAGWEKPVIEPLKHLSIHPGAKVLHYATEVNIDQRSSCSCSTLLLDLRRHESLSRERWDDSSLSTGFEHETNVDICGTKCSTRKSRARRAQLGDEVPRSRHSTAMNCWDVSRS